MKSNAKLNFNQKIQSNEQGWNSLDEEYYQQFCSLNVNNSWINYRQYNLKNQYL